jgi:VWFA-related protein
MLSRRNFLYLAGVALARGQDAKFSSSVNVVNVLATVRDKQGKVVRDLIQDEFTIQEDGRPQTIRYFSQQSDLPLTLGLLLDTSGSQLRVLDQERAASHEFFQHILREDKDKAFLVQFAGEVELLQDLTSSRKDLEAALRDAGPSQTGGRATGTSRGRGQGRGGFGGTALYDSIYLAADEVLKKQEGRKAVVLLSDGVDNGSKTSIGSAIESAQRADMLVYSIRFADSNGYGNRGPVGFGGGGRGGGRGGRRGGGGAPFPQPQAGRNVVDGKKILERISQETGGGYFEVSKKMPLDKIYDEIEEELRSQYSLGYNPDQSSGGYHKISVSVKRKNLTVRARDGYYT